MGVGALPVGMNFDSGAAPTGLAFCCGGGPFERVCFAAAGHAPRYSVLPQADDDATTAGAAVAVAPPAARAPSMSSSRAAATADAYRCVKTSAGV